jgi:hypothetical protein
MPWPADHFMPTCVIFSQMYIHGINNDMALTIFVSSAFINQVNTQTMQYQVNCTQQHCYDFPKNLIPWGIRTRVCRSCGDAMSTSQSRQGRDLEFLHGTNFNDFLQNVSKTCFIYQSFHQWENTTHFER